MAERAVPMPIQVAEALVAELEKIGKDDETKWRTAPASVLLGPGVDLGAARPSIQVVIGGATGGQWTSDLNEDVLELFIYCVTEGPENPDRALWDLLSDVRRCVNDNLKLQGVLSTGLLQWISSAPYIEGVQGKAGTGLGTVMAEATYKTTDADS